MTDPNCISTSRPRDAADPNHKYCRCMKSAHWQRKVKLGQVQVEREQPSEFERALSRMTPAERVLLIAQLEEL